LRRFIAVAGALLAAIVPGCGGDESGTEAPQGPPAARHGAQAVRDLVAVEEVRTPLQVASALYGLGEGEPARTQVRAGELAYAPLSPVVRARAPARRAGWTAYAPPRAPGDPALDRELRAGFRIVRAGISQRVSARPLQQRIAALGGQILDAAAAVLVPKTAREDAGLRAEVLVRLTDRLVSAYELASNPRAAGSPEGAERAQHLSWGLLRRAIAYAHGIGSELGPQKNLVIGTLNDIGEEAYPVGVASLRGAIPSRALREKIAQVQTATRTRFGL
jgi:hypothetical protein